MNFQQLIVKNTKRNKSNSFDPTCISITMMHWSKFEDIWQGKTGQQSKLMFIVINNGNIRASMYKNQLNEMDVYIAEESFQYNITYNEVYIMSKGQVWLKFFFINTAIVPLHFI